jgi:hypothetical protein
MSSEILSKHKGTMIGGAVDRNRDGTSEADWVLADGGREAPSARFLCLPESSDTTRFIGGTAALWFDRAGLAADGEKATPPLGERGSSALRK